MISVRVSEVGDADKIQARDVFSGEDFTGRLKRLMPGCYCHTMLIDDEPVAIIGGSVIWPGVAKAWAVISDKVQSIPLSFHKFVLYIISSYQEIFRLHRLQFSVKAGYTQGERWAESLGFSKEGVMKQYGINGEDYILFARSWPCFR